MLQKSTWLHLRIPFSFYLLPVFMFACATVEPPLAASFWVVFFILHFLLYPASNAFNSFFDKDEGSSGGLERPPAVSSELYHVALLLDGIAVALGLFLSWVFAAMLFVYGLASKAYSHPVTRWKRRPFLGWFIAGFFQGYFSFLMVAEGLVQPTLSEIFSLEIQWPAVLSSLLLWGSYPMTQVYQHQEDGKRGDETLSRKLGILGTFHFTAVCFTVASAGFVAYFYSSYGLGQASAFLLAMLPVLVVFARWYVAVRKNPAAADYKNTMRLNLVSALCLNVFFAGLWWAG